MATRDDLYAKFGLAAEAAQLFETELGTLLLTTQGAKEGWLVVPDSERASQLWAKIDQSTLGLLLVDLKKSTDLDHDLVEKFAGAVKARNRLFHGFFERHNFKIQTAEGRDEMCADLEILHIKLFNAWQLASKLSAVTLHPYMSLKDEN